MKTNQEIKNHLLETYMTSATPEQQEQIRNDVKIYYRVIGDMFKKGELTREQVSKRVTTTEMYDTTRLINDTMDYIGEQSTTIIAYDIIIESINDILNG